MVLLVFPLMWPSPKLTLTGVVDIVAVAILIYKLLTIIRGTRAAHILGGIVAFVVVYNVSMWAGLELLHSILSNIIPYSAIAVIILFQSEIRRTLARIGRKRWFRRGFRSTEALDEIVLALGRWSQERIGALIVIERDIGLRTFIESGVALDARLSSDLLFSIFRPGGSLHDGAVIVQKDRIAAAACFLPLSMNPALSSSLGTRHRAAIGITEESDCLSLVVSEETGRISVAAFSEIELNVNMQRVADRINRHFGDGAVDPPRKLEGSAVTPILEGEPRLQKVNRP